MDSTLGQHFLFLIENDFLNFQFVLIVKGELDRSKKVYLCQKFKEISIKFEIKIAKLLFCQILIDQFSIRILEKEEYL